MSERPNVFDPAFAPDEEPSGFQRRRATVGEQAGAQRLGASVFELEPRRTSSPYHGHLGNEELLVVLAGRPTLRTPAGSRELAPGEVVAFRLGDEGLHQVSNFGQETVRYLIVSEMRAPEVIVYPDSGKLGAYAYPPGPAREGLREFHVREAKVDFWKGETPPEAPGG